MRWHPDVPDIPLRKPKEIEKLELMDRAVLDSMPGVEIQETVDQIAHAVARTYIEDRQASATPTECEELVSIALRVTGGAIGGKVGNAMIAEADKAAIAACRLAFPKE
jgi:hypothetical protein